MYKKGEILFRGIFHKFNKYKIYQSLYDGIGKIRGALFPSKKNEIALSLKMELAYSFFQKSWGKLILEINNESFESKSDYTHLSQYSYMNLILRKSVYRTRLHIL